MMEVIPLMSDDRTMMKMKVMIGVNELMTMMGGDGWDDAR